MLASYPLSRFRRLFMETTRQKKFAKEMQRVISGLVQREVEPLVGALVTVNHVTVTADLQQVRVYITALPPERLSTVLRLLGEENREFRQLLAEEIRHQVRYIPTVQFFFDDTLARANRLDELFARIHQQDAQKSGPTEDSEPDRP